MPVIDSGPATPKGQSTECAGGLGPARWLVAGGASILTIASILWAFQFYRLGLGLLLFNEQILASMLGLAMALVFLSHPMRGDQTRRQGVPWYDWLLAFLSLCVAGYLAVRFPVLSEEMTSRPLDGLVCAFIALPLLIEALRRVAGWSLTLVVAAFLLYALVGHLVPGQLAGRPVKVQQLVYYLIWDPGSVLGAPLGIAATIVLAFIFFGQLLFASGGSSFFTDISLALMGRYRGGSAKIAITASSLFGTISGSAVSNVTSTGVITIPLMRNGGYPPHIAGAIEAVASTGGQLMPPVMGAAAFLMAEFLQVPYREIVIASILPAVLYYFAVFVQADLLAARFGITRVPEDQIPSARTVFAQGWHFIVPFVALVYTLFWLNWSAEKAALTGAAVLIATGLGIGYKGKRLALSDIADAVRSTGMAALDLMMITAAAGFVIGVLNITGLGFSLTLALVEVGGSNAALLLVLSAIVCIILGMGMPTVGVYVLLAALVAPALIKVGITPMGAHMFVMYFGMMSMITPPVALAAFAAASLAGTDPMKTGWAAVRFGWIAYVIPFLFVRAPSLLMQGSAAEVALAAVTGIAGVWLVCSAFAGYFTRMLGPVTRLGFAIAGLLMFIPAGALPYGVWTDIAGLALGAALVTREWLGGARSKAVTAPVGPNLQPE